MMEERSSAHVADAAVPSQRPPSARERVHTSPAADATHGDPRRAKSVKALEVRLNARARRQSTRHSSPACTPVLPCEWRLHSTRPGRASYHTPRAPRVWRTAVTAGVEWRYASSGGSLGLCRSFLIMCDVLEPIGPLSGPVECVVLSKCRIVSHPSVQLRTSLVRTYSVSGLQTGVGRAVSTFVFHTW